MTEYFQKNLFKDISIDEYKKLLSLSLIHI